MALYQLSSICFSGSTCHTSLLRALPVRPEQYPCLRLRIGCRPWGTWRETKMGKIRKLGARSSVSLHAKSNWGDCVPQRKVPATLKAAPSSQLPLSRLQKSLPISAPWPRGGYLQLPLVVIAVSCVVFLTQISVHR